MITSFDKYIKEQVGSGIYASYAGGSGDSVYHFWGNVGAGVLPICIKTKRILISYRSKYVDQPNTWGVFGGKIDEEDGEVQADVADVARREFKEETGFDCDCFELIPSYVYVAPNGNFKYYNFIGLFENEFEPVLDWETEATKWVTLEELIKIKPKHFGLIELLKHDMVNIKKALQ